MSGPDCISVVVLKNYEFELSYILGDLFNMFLKEPCFPDCWKLPFVVPVFNNIKESFVAKSYYLVGLLSIVGKTFEKIVNNWLLDGLGECGLKPFAPNAHFLYPLKVYGCLMLSGGTERVHWEQMDCFRFPVFPFFCSSDSTADLLTVAGD